MQQKCQRLDHHFANPIFVEILADDGVCWIVWKDATTTFRGWKRRRVYDSVVRFDDIPREVCDGHKFRRREIDKRCFMVSLISLVYSVLTVEHEESNREGFIVDTEGVPSFQRSLFNCRVLFAEIRKMEILRLL